MSLAPMTWAGFGLYLVTVLVIGGYAYFKRPDETLSDYLLGGRTLGPLTTAFTGATSVASGYQFIGLVGVAYAFGVAAFWFLIGDLLGIILQYSLAPRLRAQSDRMNSITLVDYMSDRVDSSTQLVSGVGGIIVLVFMTMYVGSQMAAAGRALEGLGSSYELGVLIALVLIISYTLMGGFLAGAWTDTIQGLMMLVGLYSVIIFAISTAGGWGGFVSQLAQQDPSLLTVTGGRGLSAMLLLGGTVVGVGSGYLGAPHSTGRLLGTRDTETASQSLVIASIVWVLIDTGSILTGWSVRIIFPEIGNPETGYTMLLQQYMPPFLAGIFLAALFAAIMSTADSQLVAGVGAGIKDIYSNILSSDTSEERMVLMSRGLVVVLAIIAGAGALQFSGVVFWFILFAWSGVACVFSPLVLLSLFWDELTEWGTVAGMVVGSSTAVFWHYTYADILYEGAVAFVVAAVVAVLVSKLAPPSQETEQSPATTAEGSSND